MNDHTTNKRHSSPQSISRETEVGHVRLSEIHPSPENDRLYRPVDPKDPEVIGLAKSIRKRGVLEPLVITADGLIISGHRRYCAARLAGLDEVPCRRLLIRRSDDQDAFVQLLREYNRQRDKTHAEKLNEELVSVNPDDAYRELYEYRRAKAAVDVKPLAIGAGRQRKKISAAKAPMLAAIQRIIEEQRAFWPLSDRRIHYALLNDPPLTHASKPDSVYRNDQKSYKMTVELLTRARLEGLIPFEAIADETRPVEVWQTHLDPRSFARDELKRMFRGYARDLMQSQPNHIELVGEKNTVGPILWPVAAEYTIPLTTGRGYCSLPPRHAMANRFIDSGKDKLVLLVVSDFDPDGEEIAKSFARSMRDDFGIKHIHPIKVALTAEQVVTHGLHPVMQAKETSSRCKGFVGEHGEDVFELEALAPDVLQKIVREAIEGVIDRDEYAREIEAERHDSAFLEMARGRAVGSLRELGLAV